MSRPVDDRKSQNRSPPPEVPDLDLIRRIGRGGFGQVWLATNRATGQLRAVKLIPLQRSGTTSSRTASSRIADPAGREIASITRLEENLSTQHPNLLNIHHVGRTADHLFYIMDPADDVSGAEASSNPTYRPATLESRLADGPLPADECLEFARQLLSGLASLHTAGMVHRDVKPANCLFVGGQLKLADFGLLTEADPQVSRVGTVKYMPPDGQMDARADVYAAGLVIYEMLTGLPVESFPRLGRRAGEIAEDATLQALNRLLLRACQGDPSHRFLDAGEMLAQLETARQPASPQRKSVRHRLAVLAALAMVGTVAAIGLWPRGPQSVSDPQRAAQETVTVNFITDPFEATIYLDGRQQFRSDGKPHTTPCTIEGLPARPHRVVFKHDTLGQLDAGQIDFAATREIETGWE